MPLHDPNLDFHVFMHFPTGLHIHRGKKDWKEIDQNINSGSLPCDEILKDLNNLFYSLLYFADLLQ